MKRLIMGFALIIILLGVSVSSSASGSTYWSYGSPDRDITVPYYYSSLSPTWASIVNNSISTWNTYSNITISYLSSSPNGIYVGSYVGEWYGKTTVLSSNGPYILSFKIQLDYMNINADATSLVNFGRSTCTHEFGHVFWLDDDPPGSTSTNSIMNRTRNRDTLYTPQTMDINNVNAKFP